MYQRPSTISSVAMPHRARCAAPHAGPEGVQQRSEVLGDGGPHLRAQRLLVRHDAGAGQRGGRVAGQAGEARDADGQAAQGALEGDVLYGVAAAPGGAGTTAG